MSKHTEFVNELDGFLAELAQTAKSNAVVTLAIVVINRDGTSKHILVENEGAEKVHRHAIARALIEMAPELYREEHMS